MRIARFSDSEGLPPDRETLDREPPLDRPPEQRPPDRDTLDRDTPDQRPPGRNMGPRTETPLEGTWDQAARQERND